jgi:uncharacterized membrane protein SpoIIM required for sporulation
MALTSVVNERAFAERRRADWELLETIVARADGRGIGSLPIDDVARLPSLYSDVCADLARAQAARYGAPLVDELQSLVASAHAVLYRSRARSRDARSHVLLAPLLEFPRAVRRHWGAMLLAALLFFVPLVAGAFAALSDPSFAFRIVPEEMLRPLTDAYAKGFAAGRESSEDAVMAGFYVQHNIGIALRCFALGIFGGLGSAIFLVQNGLSIGAILGYVASQGSGGNIVTFVVGHGSLELGAIVLCGGAGLAMGWAIVAPGDRTRIASLRAVGPDVATIIGGAAVMLAMAAGIEAFWSSSSIPSETKRILGALLFGWVLFYLVFVGRGGADRNRDPDQEGARPWTS